MLRLQIKQGEPTKFSPEPDEVYHITQVTAGKKASGTLYLEVPSNDTSATQKFPLGHLAGSDQFRVELLFQEDFELSFEGKGSAFVMGFRQEDIYDDLVDMGGDGMSDSEGELSDSEDDLSGSDEELEDVSDLDSEEEERVDAALEKLVKSKLAKIKGKKSRGGDSEDDEDVDFEEDDLDMNSDGDDDDDLTDGDYSDSEEDDDGEEDGDPAILQDEGGSDSDSYSDSEDDESEEDLKKIIKKPKTPPAKAMKQEESDSEDYSDSEISEDEESDEESDEEPPTKGAKRPATATPKSAKKAKVEKTPEPKGKPATPARTPAKTPGSAAEYEKMLTQYLKENGPQDMSALGLAIKRPAKVLKMGTFLSERKSKFKRDGNKISLA